MNKHQERSLYENVLQISEKSKVKKAKAADVMSLRKYEALELDNKVTLIHELIPLGLMHIKEELLVEVRNLSVMTDAACR
jgi:hypothetical protein